MRLVRVPEKNWIKLNRRFRQLPIDRHLQLPAFSLRWDKLYFNGSARRHVFAFEFEFRGCVVNIRHHPPAVDITGSTGLQIHRLPDATAGGVPPPLFAHRLLVIIEGIFDSKHDQAAPGPIGERLKRIRDVEFQRQVPGLMFSEMHSVAPAIRKKIRGANLQNYTPALPRLIVRNSDPTAIPTHLVARREPVIFLRDLQRVQVNARGIIILVPR
jgi:hypothetical protein